MPRYRLDELRVNDCREDRMDTTTAVHVHDSMVSLNILSLICALSDLFCQIRRDVSFAVPEAAGSLAVVCSGVAVEPFDDFGGQSFGFGLGFALRQLTGELPELVGRQWRGDEFDLEPHGMGGAAHRAERDRGILCIEDAMCGGATDPDASG